MTERLADTTLATMERASLSTLATVDNSYDARDILVELGLTHLQMEPEKLFQAFQEIWAGMHGRSGIENLGIVATVFGTMSNNTYNPLTQEYAVALAREKQQSQS